MKIKDLITILEKQPNHRVFFEAASHGEYDYLMNTEYRGVYQSKYAEYTYIEFYDCSDTTGKEIESYTMPFWEVEFWDQHGYLTADEIKKKWESLEWKNCIVIEVDC